MNFLFVFIGGGLGAMARYGMTKISPAPESDFPLATFLTNILSCIVLGFLIGYLLQKSMTERSQLVFMTGFCGGFSTFSTFSAETFRLMENGQTGLAISYVIASVIISLLAIFCGMKLVSLV